MMLNAKPSEMIGVVGNIDPDAYAAGTVTTGWIAAKDFQSFVAIVQAGDLINEAGLAHERAEHSGFDLGGIGDDLLSHAMPPKSSSNAT